MLFLAILSFGLFSRAGSISHKREKFVHQGCAVLCLRRNVSTDFSRSLQRANILKEVQIMRQLDHPNIIKLIDFSESKQHYYIILQLAPGGELFHQIVRLTYFSEDLSRHVITQVAEALEYLHEEKGVVHRLVSFPFVRIPILGE